MIFDLKADHITALRYVDDLYGMPVTVLPAGGFPTASGVIVSYSATTGHLQSILPFSSSKSRPGPVSRKAIVGLVYQGAFLGAFDCVTGRNLAPKGAASVTLDSKTGRLVATG